ncbi:MAG TPA: carboxypeptidase M32 [Trueperaceae bacterium]
MPYPTAVADDLSSLRKRFTLLSDLDQVGGLLGWDEQTNLPASASESRGRQSAALEAVMHEKLTDREVGEWLARLEDADLEPADATLVRLCRRRYDRAVKLPGDLVEELATQRSKGQEAWLRARRQNDYAIFEPFLRRMFELARQQAELLGYDEHPYDALHDDYEPGSSARRVGELFDRLRPELVRLAREVAGDDEQDAVLYRHFDIEQQKEFVRAEAARFGFDFERGRLDPSVHPFAEGIDPSDVRVTTRFRSDFLSSALFATLHETGHALYEQGLDPELARSPLGKAVSLGIHESQSRLWENLVARSLPYWRGAYPRLQPLFPALEGVSLEEFYRAVNCVKPSLIRVEADEVTYNLHVIARFELELAMLEGDLATADLPEAWNAKYRELLGIEPPDDLLGCLQDVHWSVGLIGYFPTYTLGNVMSVQIFEAARRSIPDLFDRIEAGDHVPLREWLKVNIHRQGSRYEPDELLERVTGTRLDAAPYLAYLQNKFEDLRQPVGRA